MREFSKWRPGHKQQQQPQQQRAAAAKLVDVDAVFVLLLPLLLLLFVRCLCFCFSSQLRVPFASELFNRIKIVAKKKWNYKMVQKTRSIRVATLPGAKRQLC